MNKRIIARATFLALALSQGPAFAGTVDIPNTFTAGTPAVAADVNDNFDAVETAVDDNAANIQTNSMSITTNSEDIDTLQTDVTNLQNATPSCPTDMTQVGDFCIDTFEATLFDAATGGNRIANRLGDANGYCLPNGSDCTGIFARSDAATVPHGGEDGGANGVTWFQAAQACANVGKRLPSNAEWQMAAVGTNAADVDTNCNVGNGSEVINAASANPLCVSSFGVVNMAGNVSEWVADWIQPATNDDGIADGAARTLTADGTPGDEFGGDTVVGVQGVAGFPAAIIRGGRVGTSSNAGEFAYSASGTPDFAVNSGFRCAKNL